MKIVGIDVHKKMRQAAILEEDGKLLDEIRFANDPEEIEELAGKLSTFHDEVKAVVESTGNLWIQIHDRLEEHGFDVAYPTHPRLASSLRRRSRQIRSTPGPSPRCSEPTCCQPATFPARS